MALSYMRRHKRWLYGFLWIIIAAFIVFYIPAFLDKGEGMQAVVARVGKRKITVDEFRTAYYERLRNYERFSKRRLDLRMAKRMRIPEAVLQSLVESTLIDSEAARLGVTVDDAALKRAVTTLPLFQRNGQFVGAGEVRRFLDSRQMSEEQFLSAMRQDLVKNRLEALITDGIDVTPVEIEREYRRRNEKVRVEYALADSARFRSAVTPSSEEVKAFFEAHRETYRFPERRVASYVLIAQDALAREVAVTERDAQTYYDDNQDDFTQPEQACASHIQVKVKTSPEDSQGHEDAQARSIAQGLLDQIKKGADFAALAKKSSEDPGSAPNGGDLQCFPRGQMPPELDEAIFALSPGQISDLVKTSAGYHIVRLNRMQEQQTTPFAQVRAGIEGLVRREKAEERLEEKVMALGRALNSGDGLSKAAQDLGFAVQKTAPFARGAHADPLTPEAVSAAFELKPGETKREPFSAPKGAVFISLASVEPSRLPELKEVEAQVRADLIESGSLEKALDLARQVSARARGEGLDKAARALGLTRKDTPGLVGRGQALGELGANVLLEQAVFSLDVKKISDPVRVAAGYAVVGMIEKKPFDPAAFEKDKESIADSLRTDARQKVFQAFLAQAAERYGVERTEAFRTALSGGR
jgi:peptidyl-prolyl cis-trans isomerase D